jgi:hypothetical protein
MTETHKIEIAFPGKTPDVAGRLVEDLSKEIRRSVKEDGRPVEPHIVRTDPTAQDFGSTLVLALGTPAITYLARAIFEWAKRTNNSDIEINRVRINRIESRDVADVIAALQAPNKRSGHGAKQTGP